LYEDEYIASDDEINIARKTSRTQKYDPELKKGRGFSEALVPSFAMNIALKTQMVLDFGAGKHPFYVMKYRDMGFNIYGWDLPESMRYWEENYEEEIQPPGGLSGQFDLVYASNVMNVAPNENFLKRMTLDTIKKALKPSGVFIGNYPASPRKNPEMTPAMLKGVLEEYFMGVQYYNNKKIFVCTQLI
jgi:SAM-dependent methyltransferase